MSTAAGCNHAREESSLVQSDYASPPRHDEMSDHIVHTSRRKAPQDPRSYEDGMRHDAQAHVISVYCVDSSSDSSRGKDDLHCARAVASLVNDFSGAR